MKKSLYCLFTAAILLTACEKEETSKEVVAEPNAAYVGLLQVNQNDGSYYQRDSVKVSTITTGNDSLLTLVMYKVSFSQRMPVTLDMTIPHVVYKKVENGLQLHADSIVPFAMGGEFPKYTITGLHGKVQDGTLTLEMNCGDYPLTYCGK